MTHALPSGVNRRKSPGENYTHIAGALTCQDSANPTMGLFLVENLWQAILGVGGVYPYTLPSTFEQVPKVTHYSFFYKKTVFK